MTAGGSTPHLSWPKAIGWGAFLACSWTWCIGMFLPILFVRDYGIWGFVVFAAPNVIGAAAMGWVLRKPGASAAILENHKAATAWFSAITIAFQVFFLAWFMGSFIRNSIDADGFSWIAVAVIPVIAIFVAPSGTASSQSNTRRRLGACAIWLVSIIGVVLAVSKTNLDAWALPTLSNNIGVAFLTPVCTFGFLACPYLDRTFLRTRQSAPGPTGTAAFFIGFGILFFAMILFTLFYTSGVLHVGSLPMYIAAGGAGMIVCIHIIVQLAYTISVHHQEIAPNKSGAALGFTAAALLAFFAFAFNLDTAFRSVPMGEILYRCFISCYGFIFPAYVYLLMIPTKDGHRGTRGESGKFKLRVFFLAVGIAAPMMYIGFIEKMEIWLVPGIAVVLLSRLALPRK